MGNKPDKFGIKFWLAADVNSKYMQNGSPYLGKEETRSIVQLMGECVAETGRAIPGERKKHHHRQFLRVPKTGHCLTGKEDQPGWHSVAVGTRWATAEATTTAAADKKKQVRKSCKQNKTLDTCSICHKPVCGSCVRRAEVICVSCDH